MIHYSYTFQDQGGFMNSALLDVSCVNFLMTDHYRFGIIVHTRKNGTAEVTICLFKNGVIYELPNKQEPHTINVRKTKFRKSKAWKQEGQPELNRSIQAPVKEIIDADEVTRDITAVAELVTTRAAQCIRISALYKGPRLPFGFEILLDRALLQDFFSTHYRPLVDWVQSEPVSVQQEDAEHSFAAD